MEKISKEEFRKMVTDIVPKAVEFSNFCQKFKMDYWQSADKNYEPITESVLDHLAMIAWKIINK